MALRCQQASHQPHRLRCPEYDGRRNSLHVILRHCLFRSLMANVKFLKSNVPLPSYVIHLISYISMSLTCPHCVLDNNQNHCVIVIGEKKTKKNIRGCAYLAHPLVQSAKLNIILILHSYFFEKRVLFTPLSSWKERI